MTKTDLQAEGARLSIGDAVKALQDDFPDVSPSSLRFLEREGLISATRTGGGHRIYTPDDIDRLRQIKRWQEQRLSLQQIRERLAALDRLPAADALAERFLKLASAGDHSAAQALILSVDDAGMPLLSIFGEVLRPALYEAGRQWERGELAVAQEKELSELTRELIIELANRHAPASSPGPVVVAAAAEGERHELGLRMICGLLRTLGYQIHFLGADVAPRFLAEAVQLYHPDAVLLSITLESHLFAVRDAAAALRAAQNGSPVPCIIAGGDAIAARSSQIAKWGAVPVAHRDLADLLAAIERLVPYRQPATPQPAGR